MSSPIDVAAKPQGWHRPQWQRLLAQAGQQRLPHALLVAGPAGVGKTHFAQALAAFWLCSNPGVDGACGSCQSCRLLAAGSHPDFCFPATSGKSEQLRVDEIRDVVEFAGKTAQLGRHRLVLLEPACSMNRSAQNALLKTLEEPGENTLLLLVADRLHLLLPTVRSRCQQLLLPPPATPEALEWLAGQGLTSAAAEAALAAAAGAPLAALELAGKDWFTSRGDWVNALLALAQGRGSVAQLSQQLARHPQAELLAALGHWTQQSLRSGYLKQPSADPAVQKFVELLRLCGARRMSLWHLSLGTALGRLSRNANLNKELQLDQLLWQLTPQGAASNLHGNP